jgi:hypothetical protein
MNTGKQLVNIPPGSTLKVSPGTTLTMGNGSKFTTTTSFPVDIVTDKQITIDPPHSHSRGGGTMKRKMSSRRKSKSKRRRIV